MKETSIPTSCLNCNGTGCDYCPDEPHATLKLLSFDPYSMTAKCLYGGRERTFTKMDLLQLKDWRDA